MKLRVVGVIVFMCSPLIFGLGVSQANDVVWTQQPNITPLQGYAYASESHDPGAISDAADDFVLTKVDDIAKIRWWGTYWNPRTETNDQYPFYYSNHWSDPDPTPPDLISKFRISFYTDNEAGGEVPLWAYPASMIDNATFDIGTEVTESYYATINGPGYTQTVFQYEVDIDQAVDFPNLDLQEGQTYWISIRAEEPVMQSIIDEPTYQWGWQNSIVSYLPSNAVQKGYAHGGGDIGWWYELPGEGLAFEMDMVPEPSSMILLAVGSMVFLGKRQRRKQRV